VTLTFKRAKGVAGLSRALSHKGGPRGTVQDRARGMQPISYAPPVPGRDHPARDVAVSAVHAPATATSRNSWPSGASKPRMKPSGAGL